MDLQNVPIVVAGLEHSSMSTEYFPVKNGAKAKPMNLFLGFFTEIGGRQNIGSIPNNFDDELACKTLLDGVSGLLDLQSPFCYAGTSDNCWDTPILQ